MREDFTFDTIRMLNGFKPFLHHHYSRINTSCGDEDFDMIVAEFYPRNSEVERYRMSFSSVVRLGCWLAGREILFRDFSGVGGVLAPPVTYEDTVQLDFSRKRGNKGGI
jgi:hypothetical protein